MKNNNTIRTSIYQRKNQQQAQQISIELIKQKIINQLKNRSVPPQFYEDLESISNIDQLLEKFSELSSTFQSANHSLPTIQKQLLFHKERILMLEKKIKDTSAENLSQMKQLSAKQEQIMNKEAQIFELKQTLEQKERSIIQLTKELRSKKTVIPLNTAPKSEQKDEQIKIVVNTPKVPLKSQKIEKTDSSIILPESWSEQKIRLLRVIKEKDLKIYQLIQQLQAKK